MDHGTSRWIAAFLGNEDGTFTCNPFSHEPDARYVAFTLKFANKPFRLWIQRVHVYAEELRAVLDCVDRVNTALFCKFD